MPAMVMTSSPRVARQKLPDAKGTASVAARISLRSQVHLVEEVASGAFGGCREDGGKAVTRDVTRKRQQAANLGIGD
ncbi:MAG: hypothetical protein HC937_00330 [Aquincola sp.]|nr:hypothetical protein [Aquincola sp.]